MKRDTDGVFDPEVHSWNAEGQLASLEYTAGPHQGVAIQYGYDAAGSLVERKVVEVADLTVLDHDAYLVGTSPHSGTSEVLAVVDGTTRVPISFTTFGLVTRTLSTDEEGESSETTYTYDAQGRQLATYRDGELTGSTAYEVTPQSMRRRISTDSRGNRSITVTDSAGRTVQEIFEGVKGAHRKTEYRYDPVTGAQNYVRAVFMSIAVVSHGRNGHRCCVN